MQVTTGAAARRGTGGLTAFLGPLLVLLLSAGGLAVAWTTTSSDPGVVTWWLAVVGAGVLLPGWALVRCVHGAGSNATDLGWAGPAGIVVALLTWLVGHLVGVSMPSLVVGPAVAVVLLAVPATRRRLVGVPGEGTRWPLGAWVALAATTLLTVRWMWVYGLAVNAPEPTARFQAFHQDLLYQTALTGEARRSLDPSYPMVAGEPLGYHWFFHALAAQLGGSGLHDLDVVSRLLPSTLVVLLALLAAAVGAQVTGHWTGGLGAAVAVSLVRPFSADPWAQGPLAVLGNYWQLSPTATLGWVLGLALTGGLVALLRRSPLDRAVPLWLLPFFAAGAAGAKSAQVPVIVCGVGLAGLAYLVAGRGRAGRGRTLLLHGGSIVGLLVVVALALAFIYPGSYGLRLDLLAWPGDSAKQVYGTRAVGNSAEAVAAGVTFVRRWLPMLLPCAGLLVLLRRRPSEPAGWIGLGVLVGGLVAVLSLTHPSASQYYFAAAALPIGLALSGAGAGLFVHEALAGADGLPGGQGLLARGRGLLVPVVLVVTTVVGGLVWQAMRQPGAAPRVSPAVGAPGAPGARTLAWQWASPTLLLVGVLLVVVTLAWGARTLRREQPRAGSWGGLLALAALAIGLLALVPALKIGVTPGAPVSAAPGPMKGKAEPRPAVSPSLYAAGQYLRQHADPDDVVATNRIWNGRTPAGYRDNRDFSVVALSGLRTDVSGYGYAPRMLQTASEVGVPYFYAPFWDQPRLDAELALVTSPTRAMLDAAYRERGIRWIVADERSGAVSPSLATLTDVVMHQDGVWLARLRTPAP
ncbi:hypothetical protein GCM10009868_24130 [Terrabacter aerolatus]|uniref:Uncharacterized protein n=1 Tax=Terrabacter aerolatus TaxID=422442 RepID=A0A512D1H3_9MICO|nr:hypothetical protein [Terrabacter aerolatus]GEO30322.1 hypothetical protein TAE01_21320 [Terrabacter aerolatus]